jgi:hypothetical protein
VVRGIAAAGPDRVQLLMTIDGVDTTWYATHDNVWTLTTT